MSLMSIFSTYVSSVLYDWICHYSWGFGIKAVHSGDLQCFIIKYNFLIHPFTDCLDTCSSSFPFSSSSSPFPPPILWWTHILPVENKPSSSPAHTKPSEHSEFTPVTPAWLMWSALNYSNRASVLWSAAPSSGTVWSH